MRITSVQLRWAETGGARVFAFDQSDPGGQGVARAGLQAANERHVAVVLNLRQARVGKGMRSKGMRSKGTVPSAPWTAPRRTRDAC